jgi:hypothetical protein
MPIGLPGVLVCLCDASWASPSAATRQTATNSERRASQMMGIRMKSMNL